MRLEHLAGVLHGLALTFPRAVTPEVVEVYAAALADLTDDELAVAAAQVVRRERFFPVPAVLRDYARPADPAAAGRALARIRDCVEYSPELGDIWRLSAIREQVGEAAAHAIQAAGGTAMIPLMADPFHGPGLLKVFRAAYDATVAREPALALPAGPAPTLAQLHAEGKLPGYRPRPEAPR